MRKEESQTELGAVGIHKNAIASIVAIAATEIEGVKGIGKSFKTNILALMGKQNIQTATIKVEVDKNNEVKVSIPIIVKYGFNIPEISNKVQENISNALEKMTNLSTRDINVNIVGIERG